MDKHIAYILCDRPANFDIEDVIKAVRSRYPSLSVETAAPPGGNADASLIQIDGKLVAVMNMPVPLPYEAEEWVWARAEKTWPEARAVASGHRAHVIVAMVSDVGTALQGAGLVTAVAGALLDVVAGCQGVLWGTSLLRPAQMWRQDSLSALAAYPDYPTLLWVDVQPVATPSGIEVMTVGLAAFIGREIECPIGKQELLPVLGNVTGLACYLTEHGDVVKDGDTIGGSETERIVVRHAVSKHFSGLPVLRIVAG